MILFNLTRAYTHASPPLPLTSRDGQGGVTSLMLASQNGHVEAVRVLIKNGALIEAATEVHIHAHASTHTVHNPSYTHT
jgi:hypothetical protein